MNSKIIIGILAIAILMSTTVNATNWHITGNIGERIHVEPLNTVDETQSLYVFTNYLKANMFISENYFDWTSDGRILKTAHLNLFDNGHACVVDFN